MFCPKCKALMFPEGGKLRCRRCDITMDPDEVKRAVPITTEKQEKQRVIVEEQYDLLPKTKVNCPKCDHNEAYWILRQTRAADEPETRIYTCTKCGHKWREF
jgi:DNA-directed RNA polymerase subunit M